MVPLLLALLVGTWVAISITAGSFSIPHNDAWAHTRISETLVRTGQVELVGWNRSALMGIIIPAALLGGSALAGNIIGALSALLTLYWTYKYARFHVPPRLALVIVATIAVVPGMALLSTSFMADVPMCAGIAGALYYCQKYFNRDKRLDLMLAMVLALWSFTIREQGLAMIVAIGIVLVLKKHYKNALLFIGLSVLAALFFEFWRRGLSHDDPPVFEFNFSESTGNIFEALLSLSLFFLPITVLGSAEKKFWNKKNSLVAILLSALAVSFALHENLEAFPPNYLSWKGAYAVAFVGERIALSPLVVQGLCLLAALAVGPLCVFSVRHLMTTENLVGKIFSGLYFLGILAQTYAGQATFDRYMIPLLLALAPTIIEGTMSRARSKVFFFASAGLLFFASSALFLESSAYEGATWKAAQQEVASGTSPTRVQAGFAWTGYHSAVSYGDTSREAGADIASETFARNFSDVQECVIIGSYDSHFVDPETVQSYRRYLFFGLEEHLYSERVASCKK